MAAARRCGETRPTSKVPIFGGHLAVFAMLYVINDESRVRIRARSGESWGIEAVALAVLVDR